jgi:hypothetical protein
VTKDPSSKKQHENSLGLDPLRLPETPFTPSRSGAWSFLHIAITDSNATNNVIKLSLFACIFLLAAGLSIPSIIILSNGNAEEKRHQTAANIINMIGTGILGLGAGAGLR